MTNKTFKIVLSGGPGGGKTTLLRALKEKEFVCYEEYSRTVIDFGRKAYRSKNFFMTEPQTFSKMVFEGRKRQFEAAQQQSLDERKPYVFFDRGIHDVYAYLKVIGEANEVWKKKIVPFSYDLVFLCPPWKEIHTTDEHRKETYEASLAYYEAIKAVYVTAGISTIEVPKDTVENRTLFTLNHLPKING